MKKSESIEVVCKHTISSGLLARIRTAPVSSAIQPINGKIYWHIVNFTKDQEKEKTIKAFEDSFNLWQPHFAPIFFESTSDPRIAAIKINFKNNGDRGLPEKFGRGVLAYAFFPSRKSLGVHSDMFFNDGYVWAERHSANAINLRSVMTHELGHAFGLDHSTIPKDIMFATYQGNDSISISKDTLDGIEKLYGSIKSKISAKGPSGIVDIASLALVFTVEILAKTPAIILAKLAWVLGIRGAKTRRQLVQEITERLGS